MAKRNLDEFTEEFENEENKKFLDDLKDENQLRKKLNYKTK